MKIAVTGLPKSGKTFLGEALSNITGIPFIQNMTLYEWYKLYNIQQASEWKDMFLIASSSFINRIEMEMKYENFISDGASFSETIYAGAMMNMHSQNRIEKERHKILESLENVSARYAVRQYDFVVHLMNNACRTNEEDMYIRFFNKNNIHYKSCLIESFSETLRKILAELHLPVKMSIENALYESNKSLFHEK